MRNRISRAQLDFLLLDVFGWRYLPNEVAIRLAARREAEVSLNEVRARDVMRARSDALRVGRPRRTRSRSATPKRSWAVLRLDGRLGD